MQGQRCIQMSTSKVNDKQLAKQVAQEEEAKEEDSANRLPGSERVLDNPEHSFGSG